MTDKKAEQQEMTTGVLLADVMLRVTAMEKLLLDKGLFSKEELAQVTDEIAKKVAKVVLEKAQASQNIDEFIANLESSAKGLKN